MLRAVQNRWQELSPALRDDLLKILVEKLLIGLLIVAAGAAATCVIEATKKDLELTQAVSQKRLDAFAAAWRHIYLMQNQVDQREVLRALLRGRLSASQDLQDSLVAHGFDPEAAAEIADTAVTDSAALSRSASLYSFVATQARASVDSNRFWLGEEPTTRLLTYIGKAERYLALGLRKDSVQSALKDSLDSLREDAARVLQSLRD